MGWVKFSSAGSIQSYCSNKSNIIWVKTDHANPSGHAVYGAGLQRFAGWDCGLESRLEHGYLPFMSVVCRQVDRESSIMRRPWPTRGCCDIRGGDERLQWTIIHIISLDSDPTMTEERCIYCKRTQKITTLNVPRQWPVVLLLKEGWKHGRVLGIEGERARRSGQFQHKAEERRWAFRLKYEFLQCDVHQQWIQKDKFSLTERGQCQSAKTTC